MPSSFDRGAPSSSFSLTCKLPFFVRDSLVDCHRLCLRGRNVFRTRFLRLLTFSMPSSFVITVLPIFPPLSPVCTSELALLAFSVPWCVPLDIWSNSTCTLHRLIVQGKDTIRRQHEIRKLGRASISRGLQGAHTRVQDAVFRDEGSRFARCLDLLEQKTDDWIPESPYLHSPSLLNPSAYYPGQSTVAQLPVLTTFIPSLPHNTAFRVSVHSWEKPRPSRTMESLMQPDDSVLYEVRIFIDGLCVAWVTHLFANTYYRREWWLMVRLDRGSIFGQRTAWPHVIGK